MSLRLLVAALLLPIAQAVVFGAGTVVILSVPLLAENAARLFPPLIAFGLIVSPPLAWRIAPCLASRCWRERIGFELR